MTRQRQQHGGHNVRRILFWLAMTALPLCSSCGKKERSKTSTEISKPTCDDKTSGKAERVPVTSSNLRSVGYDESSRTLTVEFHNGSVYEYGNVPPEVHAELMKAQSHGKYFHSRIRSAGYATNRVQ